MRMGAINLVNKEKVDSKKEFSSFYFQYDKLHGKKNVVLTITKKIMIQQS